MLKFTVREIELIKLLASGKSNQEIGKAMFISVHTVKKILDNIYQKTCCHNRVQIAVYAIKNSLTE